MNTSVDGGVKRQRNKSRVTWDYLYWRSFYWEDRKHVIYDKSRERWSIKWETPLKVFSFILVTFLLSTAEKANFICVAYCMWCIIIQTLFRLFFFKLTSWTRHVWYRVIKASLSWKQRKRLSDVLYFSLIHCFFFVLPRFSWWNVVFLSFVRFFTPFLMSVLMIDLHEITLQPECECVCIDQSTLKMLLICLTSCQFSSFCLMNLREIKVLLVVFNYCLLKWAILLLFFFGLKFELNSRLVWFIKPKTQSWLDLDHVTAKSHANYTEQSFSGCPV